MRKDKPLQVLARPAADVILPAPKAVAVAMKALYAGTANPHQQKTALEWIMREAGGKGYFPYHASDRDTCLALGRLLVADAIVGLITAEISLRNPENVPSQTHPTKP
jgi:hypothetical protein